MIPGRIVLVVLALATVGMACPRRTPPDLPTEQIESRVTVAHPEPERRGRASGWDGVVFPPVYARPVLPSYPPEAERMRVGQVEVAVDFVVRADGTIDRASATVRGEPPSSDLFADACLAVLPRWAFAPAWRLGRIEDGEPDVVPLDHRGRLVFTFELDVRASVGVSFDRRSDGRD